MKIDCDITYVDHGAFAELAQLTAWEMHMSTDVLPVALHALAQRENASMYAEARAHVDAWLAASTGGPRV